jgi:hypothetical protein
MMLLQLTLLATAAFAFALGNPTTKDIQKRGALNGDELTESVGINVMKRELPVEDNEFPGGENFMKRDHLVDDKKIHKRGKWLMPDGWLEKRNVPEKIEDNESSGIVKRGQWNGNNHGKVVVMKKRGSWTGDNAAGGQVFGNMTEKTEDLPPVPKKKSSRDLFDMFENGIHLGNKHVIWKRSLDSENESSGVMRKRDGTWNGHNFPGGQVVVMKRDSLSLDADHDESSDIVKRGQWNGDNSGQVVVMKRDPQVYDNKEKRGSWIGNNFGSVYGMTPISPAQKPGSNSSILQIPGNNPKFTVYGNNRDKVVIF